MDLLQIPFIKTLVEDFRDSYISHRKKIGTSLGEKDLEKEFFNELKHNLENDHYSKRINYKIRVEDENVETITRFADALMWNLWYPAKDDRPLTDDEFERVNKMEAMANSARTDRVVQFLISFFNNYFIEWQEKLKYEGQHQRNELCKILLTKRGLPVIPREGEELYETFLLMSCPDLLNKISNTITTIPTNSLTIKPDEYSPKLRQIRVDFERFFKMYFYFLNNIPQVKAIFDGIFQRQIALYKKPSGEDVFFDGRGGNVNNVDDFLASDQSKFVIKNILKTTQQELSRKGSKYVVFPQLDADARKALKEIHEASHEDELSFQTLQHQKKNLEIACNEFKSLPLIPETVVFYRKEEDIFGKHYKGNTLRNRSYVMLCQAEDIAMGKFYFVGATTKPAFLSGYYVEVPNKFIPSQISKVIY